MAESYKQKYQAQLAEKLFRAGRIGDTQLQALLEQGAIALEGYQRIWEHYAADAYERDTGEPYVPGDGEGD